MIGMQLPAMSRNAWLNRGDISSFPERSFSISVTQNPVRKQAGLYQSIIDKDSLAAARGAFVLDYVLELQSQRELNLPRVEDIAWRTEAGDRRIVQIAAAVECGDVTYVNPIEQIEEINAEFTIQSFCHF